jgi:ATP-dependent RNA/DNA helicase IGHMBP2
MSSNSSIHKFVAKQRELLDLELRAEKEEGNTASGIKNNGPNEGRRSRVLDRLEVSDVSVGLYGRTVIKLTPWSSSSSLTLLSPEAKSNDAGGGASDESSNSQQNNCLSSSSLLQAHRFTVGNEVDIRAKGGNGNQKNAISGVICAVSEAWISVAISETSSKKGRGNNSINNGSKKNIPLNDDESDNDETSILDSVPLTLVPRSSIEVHKKLVAALDRLEKHGEDHPIAGSIIRSVFATPDDGRNSGSAGARDAPKKNACFNSSLDVSQREAIAFALDPERPVALIHGPPGTGKTTTVAELIRQAVHHHGMRVLVTAPSNVAVDNILEKLTTEPMGGETAMKANSQQRKLPALRMVRLGHPARIKPSIAIHGLEALVQSSDGTEIVNDVRRELESHLRFLTKGKTRGGSSNSNSKQKQQQQQIKRQYGRRDKLDRRTAYKEIRSLRKEVRQREEKVVSELISSAHVVLATTVGADNRVLNQITNPKERNKKTQHNSSSDKLGFDLVIIDEAAQALEASCWIPILRGRKVVLAGDHCQLPPTIKSNKPKVVEGLSITLFERLIILSDTNKNNRDISRMLQIQYRMHHKIADWASQAMYYGGLSTHDSVRNRTLGQLDSVRNLQRDPNHPPSEESKDENSDLDHLRNMTLLMIDTAGCDMHERETEAGSRYNEGEAMLVNQHVRKLLVLGLDQTQVAIITPYNGQVELLRNQLLPEFPKLEIRSVDGFQGGEKEAVVLSLVRSNDQHGRGRGNASGIGFLKDDRRQNVAVTRAKRHMAVICDSDTVSQSPFINNLLQWIEHHGEERSAIEYISETTHSASNQEYEDDFRAAESELIKLFGEESPTEATASKVTSIIGAPANDLPKEPPSDAPQKVLEETKRKALMDKIARFVEKGTKGEEMVLSSELSSFDRRLVHEFAEQTGLGHRCEGRDGIDRKIILWIQNEAPATILARHQAAAAAASKKTDTTDATPPERETQKEEAFSSAPKCVSNFSALTLNDVDSDSDASYADTNQDSATPKRGESSAGIPVANSLLAQLAKERAERQRQQQKAPTDASNSCASSKKKKKTKTKGNRLGRAKKPQALPPPIEEDDLDEMAFLDAQIETSQNAHGRKVVGNGKNYRTMVNGILNSTPEPRPKTNNNGASAALRHRLSQAGNARKKKKK